MSELTNGPFLASHQPRDEERARTNSPTCFQKWFSLASIRMASPVITVENLGKRYRIRHEQQRGGMRYKALRDVLAEKTKGVARRLWRAFRSAPHSAFRTPPLEDFWALKDLNFEIQQGEVVGIIGRNGAGKSTLLKILSRITEPTRGRVRILGRVGSLLEVGTGFHPELTGRENIFLNGAILGMTRAEIKNRLDEIVAFAAVERFLDTPVKRYSSGMNLRLAFAVAAHLEPEILIVDEVLAVGDAQFQRKCMGKMRDVASNEGSTILFVSHNMGAVLSLCTRAALLSNGSIALEGDPQRVVSSYSTSNRLRTEYRWDADERPGDEVVRLDAVRITDDKGQPARTVSVDTPFFIEMDYQLYNSATDLEIGFRLCTADGVVVFTSTPVGSVSCGSYHRVPGRYRARCVVPGRLLGTQTYLLSFGAHQPNIRAHFLVDSALEIAVEQTRTMGRSVDDGRAGVINPALAWSVLKLHKRDQSAIKSSSSRGLPHGQRPEKQFHETT